MASRRPARALVCTVPLVGMSFQGDERPRIYAVVSRYGPA